MGTSTQTQTHIVIQANDIWQNVWSFSHHACHLPQAPSASAASFFPSSSFLFPTSLSICCPLLRKRNVGVVWMSHDDLKSCRKFREGYWFHQPNTWCNVWNKKSRQEKALYCSISIVLRCSDLARKSVAAYQFESEFSQKKGFWGPVSIICYIIKLYFCNLLTSLSL